MYYAPPIQVESLQFLIYIILINPPPWQLIPPPALQLLFFCICFPVPSLCMLTCHGLDCTDLFMQIIIGTALVLILSHSPSSRITLLSDDSRTCDGLGSMAFHDVPFLGPVY
jgi:hypothetical protein